MDDKLGQHGGSLVALASVPQHQLVEVFELIDGEVSSERRLLSFFSNDTDANVGLEDHADVISSVTNSGGPLASRGRNLLRDDSLLSGTTSAHTNTRRLGSLREEVALKLLVAKDDV